MIRSELFDILSKRLEKRRDFIQVIIGPRQVGKTTLVHQVLKKLHFPSHYVSADTVGLQTNAWLEAQWEIGRQLLRENKEAVLVIDEIQKIPDWSSYVKKQWDKDTQAGSALKVVLLGSSPLLLQNGLTESLAGRFEIIHARHWSFEEMRQAFEWDIERYIYFGGYPGAAPLIDDELRWKNYLNDSLIETTISRDVLLMTRIEKPALLRRLFQLSCQYSSQILSYQKMLGQLHDAGNTTTLSHYLRLLAAAGMVGGIEKFNGKKIPLRASSPKLLVFNTGLMSAQHDLDFKSAKADKTYWGRLVESTIGAYLLNEAFGKNIQVFYWREANKEVDFILMRGDKIVAIEVKSGQAQITLDGLALLKKDFPKARVVLVGNEGISIEDFLKTPIGSWFE
jgi:predicted AAA+ superfamily ATPase